MGKVSRAFFESVIAHHLGAKRKDVAVGPANGVDLGVVRLPDGRALLSTTDPIYIVPQYGWERAAWFAFHILASDLTTSGVAPQYITMDWNLPMDIEDDQIETMLQVIDRESKKYGAAIVTGHTGRYEGCAYPMVGGATFLAIAPKTGWVTANMARPGNHLLVTKTAALEATAILSNTFPDLIERKLGAEVTKRARALFDSMSTVDDALAAATVGVRRAGPPSPRTAVHSGSHSAEPSPGRSPDPPAPARTAPRRRLPRCVTAEAAVALAGHRQRRSRGWRLRRSTPRQGRLLARGTGRSRSGSARPLARIWSPVSGERRSAARPPDGGRWRSR